MTLGDHWYVLHRETPDDPWELRLMDACLPKEQARLVEQQYLAQGHLVVVGFGHVH